MIILTLKERRLIDQAIMLFGNDLGRELWREWQRSHQAIRYPEGPIRDETGPMSRDLVAALTAALDRFEKMVRARVAREPDDNEAANMCNDLAEIHSALEAVQSAAA
jgi:hypothetical protein